VEPPKVATTARRPGLWTVVACCAVAAAVVALDAYYSAQEGWLARPPDYDGVGYMFYAHGPYHLILGLHLRPAIHELNNHAPMWTAFITAHYLVLGEGAWQTFAVRFWPTALLLVLVYWIVRNRAPRPLAIAAVVLTALIPIVSAGVRSSSWEFLSGLANFNDDWGLDDLLPDFFAIVLVLWSVALIAEHNSSLRRSSYLLSAAFAAAAVLMKPSTSPMSLAAWGAALAVTWFWNRRTSGTGRRTAMAVGLLALLLLPWAVFGHGLAMLATYYYEAAVTYRGAYATNLGLVDTAAYYLVRIPNQVGQVEALPVILGSLFLAAALLRRRLGRPEWIYAGLVVLFYAAFTATSNKNPHVGTWFALSLWIFFLAGASRFATTRWPAATVRVSPRLLAAACVYALIVYALGAFALFNWPSNEQRAYSQMASVTTDLAHEMAMHLSADQCFTYAPGPGWPASLELLMAQTNGSTPQSTPIDVDPSMTTSEYIATASKCPAVVVYREDISQVALVYFCPPVRQTYLRALADWVSGPGSGYNLARSWRLADLPPVGPHKLGRYQGISLTVDLYLRSDG
jgi:hypothetical protein